MSAKINYLKSEITSLKAQIDADKGRAAIRKLCNQAESLLSARDSLSEEPVRANVEGLVNQIASAVAAHNAAGGISIPTVTDIMSNYDAVTDPE